MDILKRYKNSFIGMSLLSAFIVAFVLASWPLNATYVPQLSAAFTGDGGILVGTGLGTYAEETGATLRTSIGVGTGDSPQFTGIELGHASDTTLTRSAAGKLAVGGVDVLVKTESITANTNPYSITPTGGWGSAERFVFLIDETSGDGHAVALSETGPPANGTRVLFINISAANSCIIPDSNGNLEIPNDGTITLESGESYPVVYYFDRWYPDNDRSNVSFASFTTTETEFIPVGWMDITDGGADPPESLYATDSNSREIKIATFDGATDENLSFAWSVPSDLTGATIKFRWHGVVTNATGPSSEDISFQLSCISVGDGEQLDFAAFGTAVAATEASVTEDQDDLITSAWSAAVTPTGLAEGEIVHCLLNRDADDADTYAQDFGLIGIDIKYQRTHDTTF